MKKLIAFTVSLSILATNLSLSLSAAFSIDYPLAQGLTYIETTNTLNDGENNHTFTFKYIPGQSTFPVVVWGNTQKSRSTLLKMADLYGKESVAGINADFFSFETGIPMGCMVSGGRFLSSQVNNNALAVFEDGTLHIGKPDIKSTVSYNGSEFNFYYNKYPQIYSLYIMDSTYYESTASDFPSLEIVLKPESESLTVNSVTECTVVSVFKDTKNTPIPEGFFVMTVPGSHTAIAHFENITPGEKLTVSVTGSEVWERAYHIIGGGDIIAENSEFIPETVNEYSDKVRYARTAVGILEDGSALFFAVNGKKSGYSSGMTIKELAEALISMGAVTVLNFDGGGSTTVGVKLLGEDEMQVMNYPTDGYPRGISNAILFLNTSESDGKPSNAVLMPNTYFVLNNAVVEIDEAYFDSSMTPIEEEPPVSKAYDVLSEGIELTGNLLTVTSSENSERKINATYVLENGERFSDDKTIYVPKTVDFIEISADKRVLNVGENTKINVRAEYYGFDAVCSLASFNWSFSENNTEELSEGVLAENDVARLLADGTFEILTNTLFTSAALIAEYGDSKAEIEIFVGKEDTVIDSFEDLTESFAEGFGSEKALSFNGEYSYETPIKLDIIPSVISLMYKGKYDGKASMTIITADGEEFEIPYIVDKDYSGVTGWTKLKAYLPIGFKDALFIKTPISRRFGEDITIDNLTASFGYEKALFEDVEDSWAKDYINSAYEMGIISGYEENGKTIFSPNRNITRAEFAKLVTVFQNLTYEYDEENIPEFNDSEKIPLWAKDYVNAVAVNNIMNGRRDGEELNFAPNDPITRTEAMLVLSRLIPEGGYIFPLNFKDNSEVPSWAREGIEKTVSAGIITGYDDNTIRPNNNITRAETAVVFSRLYKYVFEKFVTEEDTIETPNTTYNPLA